MNCYHGTRKYVRYMNNRNKKNLKRRINLKRHVRTAGSKMLLWLLVPSVVRKDVQNVLRIIRKTENIIAMTAGKERR